MPPPIDLPSADALDHDGTYLRAVTEFGEQRTIVTTAPIFAANGVKLVEAGIRINRRLYDRLLQHRLTRPIDEHLAVDGAIDAELVCESAETLIDERPFCARLATTAGGRDVLLAPLGGVPLVPQVAFKLTLMRDTQPELFAHSLQMTLVALLLGLKDGRRARALTDLATAGLVHDLGVLHIDPDLLKPGHRLNPLERQHLLAHPLTASLILKPHPEYSPDVIRAVLEHHERLDGSGYPRGLKRDGLSADGRILMLAEVVSAMFEKNWDAPGLRLSLILRLNHRKFEKTHVNALTELLRDEHRALSQTSSPDEDLARIEALGKLLADWNEPGPATPARAPHPAEAFLTPRLSAIERAMQEAGLDPSLLSFVLTEPDRDPEMVSELALLAREARWQIDQLAQETLRRWPAIRDEATSRVSHFLRQLDGAADGADGYAAPRP